MSSVADPSFETTARIRDACLCLHAQRTARALARRFDEALRPLNVTNGQFSLMNALNRPAPAAMAPVAELLGLDRTTLTAALKPLERRGLVSVSPDPDDRRGRRVKLTRKGRALLARAMPIWQHVHAELESGWASGGFDRLRADLRALG